MLAKKYRLKTKDVIFLTRKKQFFPSGYFGFFYFDQYKNLSYNQISCHITLKYSKRATDRNVLKRAVTNYIISKNIFNHIFNHNFNGRFYKIFIILNKSRLEDLHKNLENFDKKSISSYTIGELEKSFSKLKINLGKN